MNELALPIEPQLLVVVAPHAARDQMLALAATLAVRGPLRVVDAGNQFNAYPVARAVRRHTARMRAALENIRLARGFTCYQVLAMLEQLQPSSQPTLVFDLLATFYDEDVPLPQSLELLDQVLPHLSALSKAGPVVVSARPPGTVVAERLPLLQKLLDGADAVYPLLPPEALQAARRLPAPRQLGLPLDPD